MPAASRMSPDPGLFATFRGLHTAIGGNIPKSGDVRSGPTEDNALYVGPDKEAREGRAKLRRPLDVGLPPTTHVDKEQEANERPS